MAMTIFDIQRMKETNFEKGIVETFIQESDVIKTLPIETTNTTQVSTRRTNSLPDVAFRQRGARYLDGGSVGWEVVTDAVYDIGSEITIDRMDMMDKGPYIENPLEYNTKARVRAMAYKLQDAFINGDHAVDPDSFEGLKVRIGNLASSQVVYGVDDSNELDVRYNQITASVAYQFLERIDEARYQLDGHKADFCYTDQDFIRALKQSLRVIGQYVNQPGIPTAGLNERATSNVPPTVPAFEWDGTRFIDVGYKADQSTKIVANETVNSVSCRPAYFVRVGGDYLNALQMQPLEIGEPFQMDDGVSYRVVVCWYIGLRHVHPKFASKLSGVRVA